MDTLIKKHNNNKNYIWDIDYLISVFLIFSILFLPSFRVSSSLSIRIEDLLFLFIFPITIFKRRFLINNQVLIVFFLAIIELFSIIINKNILYVSALWEPIKILKFIIFLNVFFKAFIKYSQRFIKIFEIFFVLIVFMNVIQYFNLFGFNNYIGRLYIPEIHLSVFMERQDIKRLLGIMGNPNNNAILFSFFYALFMALYLSLRSKKYLYISLISFLMVILCQSRTTFLALLFSTFFIPFFTGSKYEERYLKTILTSLIIVGFIVIIYNILPISYLKSIKNMNIEEMSSWQKRIIVWNYILDNIKQQLILGTGGFKEFYYSKNIDIDSGYLWFLYNFGLISLLTYLIFLLYQIYISFKFRKLLFSYLNFSFLSIILITSITNAPFQEPRLNLIIAVTNAFFNTHRIMKERIDNYGI